MGLSLGPTTATIFLSLYEMKWLDQCPNEFRLVFYRRYVDDIFVLFESAEHLLKFHAYLNTRHPKMSFSFEQEVNGKSFVDVEVSRQQSKFVGTVNRNLPLVACIPILIVFCQRITKLVCYAL